MSIIDLIKKLDIKLEKLRNAQANSKLLFMRLNCGAHMS